MRNQVKTGIFLGVAAVAAISILGPVYSNYARNRGIVGVTEETPAFDVRVLMTAIMEYEEKYHSIPESLAYLGPPPAGKQVSGEAANLIDVRLAEGSKNGYEYHYVPSGESGRFIVTADPTTEGDPTTNHYFIDQTGILRAESGHAATFASRKYQGN
jgi:hypothetical protein